MLLAFLSIAREGTETVIFLKAAFSAGAVRPQFCRRGAGIAGSRHQLPAV